MPSSSCIAREGESTELFEPSFSGPLYRSREPLDLNKFYLIIPDTIGHGSRASPATGFEHILRIPGQGGRDSGVKPVSIAK